ncbi:MAG: hypothetical protein ACM3TN_12420 [Alphaproteobacteria bacterium]
MKNRILLDYMSRDLEGEIGAGVADYNHWRYYKSLGNVTPGRDLLGRDQTILIERERINDRPSQTDFAASSAYRLTSATRRTRASLK